MLPPPHIAMVPSLPAVLIGLGLALMVAFLLDLADAIARRRKQ